MDVDRQCEGLHYVTDFLGGNRKKRLDAWVRRPIHSGLAKRYRAGTNAMPLPLIHGSADTTVLPTASESFQKALVAAGYQSRLVEIQGADHVGSLWSKAGIETILKVATGN